MITTADASKMRRQTERLQNQRAKTPYAFRDSDPAKVRDLRWIVVSFYTVRTGYEKEILKLEHSLREFGIPYRLFPCEPLGSWRTNLNYKSEIILKAFGMFPDKDIVFIDADGVVRQHPELFDTLSETREAEVAAHFHPYRNSTRGGSLLSGTLWFANSAKGRRLVHNWHRIGKAHPDIRHQHCLRLAIDEMDKSGDEIRVYRLPAPYTLIFDYYRGRQYEPVIEHFQASRRFRREVGRGGPLLHSNFASLEDKARGKHGARVKWAVGRRNPIPPSRVAGYSRGRIRGVPKKP